MTPDGRIPAGRLTPSQAILFGGLTVGTLDALDALIFFGLRGVRLVSIFQAIAAGLLGKSAFQGRIATAGLGLALHFFIATSIVAIYYVVSRRIEILTRYPLPCGLAYGLVAYFVMTFVVVPLSAAASHPPTLPVLLNGILGHALLVGLPSAAFARMGTPHVSGSVA